MEKEQEEPAVECPKCQGSAKNKKGGECRRCNGTGKLTGQFINQVHQFIRNQAGDYTKEMFTELYKEHKKQKKERQAQVEHKNIICDRCEMSPIKGVRYHCVICDDFDICENCEKAQLHSEHPLLKVLHPSQMPARIKCTLPASHQQMEEEEEKEVVKSQKKEAAPAEKPKMSTDFKAKLVCESKEEAAYLPGERFVKTFKFTNVGTCTWLKDQFSFEFCNGDMFHESIDSDFVDVVPGQEIEFRVAFLVPKCKDNKLCEFLSLRNKAQEFKLFGPKVWCEIQVKEPEERSSLEESLEKKDPYEEKLAKINDKKIVEAMRNLKSMGFLDFTINMNVLDRAKGDINTALQLLCGEANLGQSVFQ